MEVFLLPGSLSREYLFEKAYGLWIVLIHHNVLKIWISTSNYKRKGFVIPVLKMFQVLLQDNLILCFLCKIWASKPQKLKCWAESPNESLSYELFIVLVSILSKRFDKLLFQYSQLTSLLEVSLHFTYWRVWKANIINHKS